MVGRSASDSRGHLGNGARDRARISRPLGDAARILDIADAARVRLAYTVLIQTAEANGRKDLMEKTIRRMAMKLGAHSAAARWRTFDQCLLQARFVSDKVWTTTGSRTPFGEFGRLPSSEDVSDSKASDELLDGL